MSSCSLVACCIAADTDMSSDPTIKGVSLAPSDGAGLNVVIVHTRWNKQVIDALVEGTVYVTSYGTDHQLTPLTATRSSRAA